MSKLTPWFPPEVKPVRIGYYEATGAIAAENGPVYLWSGREWIVPGTGEPSMVPEKKWRGLARNPK